MSVSRPWCPLCPPCHLPTPVAGRWWSGYALVVSNVPACYNLLTSNISYSIRYSNGKGWRWRCQAHSDRAATEAALDQALRATSAQSVLFSQAVADRVGISATDLETLDILVRSGPLTAGRLAELTGLTTGAITGLVDRLERRGYAHREPHPTDRRCSHRPAAHRKRRARSRSVVRRDVARQWRVDVRLQRRGVVRHH